MAVRPGAPTMADVARVAGVSHQTVSRVLNDSPLVRDETRLRVLAAVEQLGYRRNVAARALATRRSGMLGVIVDELHLYGPASAVVGIARAARDAGYGITLDPLWVVTGSTLAAALEHQVSQAAEAVLLVAAHGQVPDPRLLERLDIPVVALDDSLGPDRPSVGVDHRLGGRMATEHLLALGHRRIAHVRGPQDWVQVRDRHDGYLDALAAAGVEPGPVLDGDWSPAAGYAAGRALLDRGEPVTAAFVANDQMAFGFLRALTEAGLDVPGRFSVVGFDDVPEAAFSNPPLTTVRQDFTALGQQVVRLALEVIQGGRPDTLRIPPHLVVRGSTGPV